MKIYSYNTPIYFQSNRRHYKAGPNKIDVGTQTDVNRDDLDFKRAARIIHNLYKDVPKVNFYCAACSDGSESYTFDMHLRENEPYKDASQKFFPIMATDVDPTILRCANSKRLNMTKQNLESLKECGIDYKKYFTEYSDKMYIMNDHIDDRTSTYTVNDNIKNDIIFEQKSILQQASEINRYRPNVFCCRNVLPYVGDDAEQVYYIRTIGNKLGKNDLFIIGDFDRSLCNIKTLKFLGFSEIEHNIFIKRI